MHPIEQLRFVARAEGVPDRLLAVEATAALMTFADHPAAMVAACRRVLSRQPCCGPLWWSCARMLTSQDLWATAQETISALERDPTEAALRYALGESPEEVVVSRARAMGRDSVLTDGPDLRGDPGDPDDPSVPRWLVATTGTQLCDPLWDALVREVSELRSDQRRRVATATRVVALSSFTHVVGPHGPVVPAALDEPDCPVAPELLTLGG